MAQPQRSPVPAHAVCQCGADADFRADGEPLDDGKHEPEGQAVYCVACFAKLETRLPLYRGYL